MSRYLPSPPQLISVFAVLALLAMAVGVRGDVFELRSGGRVTGAVVEDTDASRVTIELTAGGRLTLDRKQITRMLPQSPAEVDYARRAPSVPDTVESQWRLAMWCREQKMSAEFRNHLRRVIELDPLHEEAHKLLGYQKVNGRWMTREDVMASRGLVRFEGEFRTRQEVEMLKRAKRSKQSRADWKGQLAQWRRWLTSNNSERSAEAEQALRNLTASGAAGPLAAMIRRENDYGVRLLLVDTAARIEHPAAVQALVQLSLAANDEETRLQCLEHLANARRPGLAAPYVQALRSNDNTRVNRAAEALGEIGAVEAISPLIDALITEHKIKVGNEGGGDQYSFTPGGGGFQFGGDQPQVITRRIKNPKVLSALVRLTEGVSFGYDQPAWREWLASRAQADKIDLRRDL